ncbi:MAG: DUF3971 domain-containing protein [Acetobacteraceae bacterium]|nr:DUF3971 domain-containing protein [Acetobacteraceae bacterium]
MRRLAGQAAGLLRLAFGTALLGLVLFAALAWRLGSGPLELPWLASLIERHASGGDLRLEVGQASLRWAGWTAGRSSPLEVRLSGLRLFDPAGELRAELPEATAGFSLRALLSAEVAPALLRFEGLSLALRRGADGSVSLDLGRPAEGAPGGGAFLLAPDGPLRALARFALRDATLALEDEASGLRAVLEGLSLDLLRRDGALRSARGEGTLRLGGAVLPISFHAEPAGEAGGFRLRIDASPMPYPAIAALLPPGSLPGGGDAAIGLTVEAELGADGGLGGLAVRARVGPGLLPIGGGRTAPIEGAVAEFRLGPDRAATGRATVILSAAGDAGEAPPRIEAALRPHPAPAEPGLLVEATLDRLPVGRLLALWPEEAAPGGRRWVAENVTEGTARDASFRLLLRQEAPFAVPELVSFAGEARIERAVVHWLRPVPPAEDARGRIVFRGDEVLVELAGGRQSGQELRATGGRLRFHNLAEPVEDHWADLSLDLAGEVAALLGLLRHPRLALLDRRPLPVEGATGRFSGRLALRFPLRSDLSAEAVAIDAEARLEELAVPAVVLGQRLDQGAFDLRVTAERLSLAGSARFLDAPARISAEIEFAEGPPTQVLERIRAEGRIGAPALLRLLPGASVLDPRGQAEVTATIERRRNGRADVELSADLARTALAVAPLGWAKPAGRPGRLAMVLRLQGDRLLAADRLQASAPDLALGGRIQFGPGARIARVEIAEGTLHGGRFAGQVAAPDRGGAPWRVSVQGPVLDLEPVLAARQEAAEERGGDGVPLVIEARFERVRLGPDRVLHGLDGRLSLGPRGSIEELRVTGRTAAAAGAFSARVTPRGGGRDVAIEAADAGALLRGLGIAQAIEGGRLVVSGRWQGEGGGQPLSGQAVLEGFAVRDAPAIGKFLQAITVIGILEAVRSPHLTFERAVVPFVLAPATLAIGEARAYSATLGLTATGRVDRLRDTLDLSGTIVPAYLLNTIPGRLPLIGRLFSPEYGGGVVAIAWRARGPAADPEVTVNPLSALTPGFLRGLFGSAAPETPAPR